MINSLLAITIFFPKPDSPNGAHIKLPDTIHSLAIVQQLNCGTATK